MARDYAYNTYPMLVQEAKAALAPIWDEIEVVNLIKFSESIYMKWKSQIPVGNQWNKTKDLPVELQRKYESEAKQRVGVIARDFNLKVAEQDQGSHVQVLLNHDGKGEVW